MKRLLLMCLLVSPLAVPLVAEASEVSRAEHQRVSEEMRKLAQRGNWPAVDDQFRRLEELEAEGESLTVKECELGADAARQIGNIAAALARYQKGARAGGSPAVIAAIEDLQARYGPARIVVDEKFIADRTLTTTESLFAPDERAALAFANTALTTGGFDGLLPKGSYTVAGKTFAVTPGGGPETVTLEPAPVPKEDFAPSFVGWRVIVGGAYTSGGGIADPQVLEAGPAPGPFSGVGPRGTFVVDLGLAKGFGVYAAVGGHTLVTGGAPSAPNNLVLGFGGLGVELRFLEGWFAAGGEFGLGAANATGVDPAYLSSSACTAKGAVGCDAEALAAQPFSGGLKAGGASASFGYGLLPMGSLRLGFALEGGALSDSQRWYPWGELALTLTPSAKRK